MKCRVCSTEVLDLVLNLGYHPLSDAFLDDLSQPETSYPLELYKCTNCGLYQLGYVVPNYILYRDKYPYRTGDNKEGVKHYTELAKHVFLRYLSYGAYVVDIGGNDGTLLKGFTKPKFNCDVLNIDPSGIECSVPVINEFFTEEYVKAHDTKHRADAVIATNVFAHIDDVHDLLNGVSYILKQSGIFVVEMPDMDKLLENCEFDTIYHEHLSYFNETSMRYLLNMHDMHITNIGKYEIHGGTNRYYIRKNSPVQ